MFPVMKKVVFDLWHLQPALTYMTSTWLNDYHPRYGQGLVVNNHATQKTFITPEMCLTYFVTQNILHTEYMYWYMNNSEEINWISARNLYYYLNLIKCVSNLTLKIEALPIFTSCTSNSYITVCVIFRNVYSYN